MRAKADCIVCLFKQALNTTRVVTDDPEVHRNVLARVAMMAQDASLDQTPAALSRPVYAIVSELTGVQDPYLKTKAETNRTALEILPELRRLISQSPDPLAAAVHAAVAGNIIDLGIGHKFDIRTDIMRIMSQPFALDAIDDFRKELRPDRMLLYLGDNAGEIVFDTLLVERLLAEGMKVTYAVKSGPVINDATMEDARTSGMSGLVPVIETGSDDIGINLDNASEEFRRVFSLADVIVGKGHGNFETCNELPGNIYSLLKAKCDMVALELGVRLGDIVFTRSGKNHSGRRQGQG